MEMDKEKSLASTQVVPASPTSPSYPSEKHLISLSDADSAARFVAGFHGTIDPKEADRVRRKIDWNLLPLM